MKIDNYFAEYLLKITLYVTIRSHTHLRSIIGIVLCCLLLFSSTPVAKTSTPTAVQPDYANATQESKAQVQEKVEVLTSLFFGLSHSLETNITRTIPGILATFLTFKIELEDRAAHCLNLRVEFYQATLTLHQAVENKPQAENLVLKDTNSQANTTLT